MKSLGSFLFALADRFAEHDVDHFDDKLNALLRFTINVYLVSCISLVITVTILAVFLREFYR